MDMTPMANNQMPPQSAPKKSTNVILIILVVVLVLGNLVSLYFFLQKPVSQPETNNTVVTNENVNQDNATTTDNELIVEDEFIGLKPLQVTWENPSEVKLSSLVKNYDNLAKYASTLTNDVITNFSDYIPRVKVYKVGMIKNEDINTLGIYNGAELYVATTPQNGPSFRPNFYRFIKYNENILLLDKHSDNLSYDPFFQPFINSSVSDFYLANLETPKEVKISNSTTILVKDKEELMVLAEDFGDMVKIADDIYFGKDCYLLIAPDGSVRAYYLKADIFNKLGSVSIGRTQDILNITWNDGSTNLLEYGPIAGPLGCGGPGCYDVVSYITSVNMLKVVGKTPGGSSIYELNDISIKESTAAKSSVLQTIYDNYYPGYDEDKKTEKSKLSFDNFLVDHPLIFWQDPFGNFIAFTNAKYAPVAECGKPVIYLYPTKTTNVSVKVNPTGGFTKTEPVYGNGWWVKAEPNGNLYNYQDQKNYPYLFWEGYALNYDRPQEGFVVAKSEVKKFLAEKLASQGLNAKEIADFMEFWLPRMQADPYYFVTFVPQSEFDKLAPLQVSPQPDTVIRVFMDYQPLSAPIKVSEQKLSTPKRQGFTVVEWGGALHQ